MFAFVWRDKKTYDDLMARKQLKLHRAYHAAYESDAFVVDFEANYESGDLTITVERTDES